MDMILNPALLGVLLIVALIIVWKCGPWVRIVAVLACAVVATLAMLESFKFGQRIAYTRFDSDITRPAGTIIFDLKQTADSGQGYLLRKKLDLLSIRWMELMEKKTTPEVFVSEIIDLTQTNKSANTTSEGIRQPADGSPKPSM